MSEEKKVIKGFMTDVSQFPERDIAAMQDAHTRGERNLLDDALFVFGLSGTSEAEKVTALVKFGLLVEGKLILDHNEYQRLAKILGRDVTDTVQGTLEFVKAQIEQKHKEVLEAERESTSEEVNPHLADFVVEPAIRYLPYSIAVRGSAIEAPDQPQSIKF
jgi:hypothetical protein